MRKIYIFLLMICCLLLIGCNEKEKITVEIIGDTTVLEGEQIKLKIKTNVTSYIANWYSYDSDIATIDEYGVVTGISEGTSKITLLIGKKAAQVNVTVEKFNVNIGGVTSLKVGEVSTLKVTYNSQKEKDIFYSSSDSNILTVDNNGNIKAISKGEAKIKVTVSGIEKTINIKVTDENGLIKPNPYEPLKVNVPNYIKYDEVVFVSANRDVIWTSSNTNVLTISEDGEVIIYDMGETIIRATDAKNQYSYIETKVIVTSGIAPQAIEIYTLDGENEVYTGIYNYLSLYVRAIGNEKEVDMRVVWSVDDESIATVDERGVLTPKKAGTVKATATSLIDSDVFSTIIINVIKR